MAAIRFLLSFGFFNLFTSISTESKISCQLRTDCILPCSFNIGSEVLIHWILKPEEIQVHSYYHNKDQLGSQNPRYKGRTSLYPEQVGRGNASLRLSNVGLQDQGRYLCYTSTINGNQETYRELEVYAPIVEVTIKKLENNLICSSDGIYPEPTLTWTIGSPFDPPQKPKLSRTEAQLYNISSSVPYNLIPPHAAATCSIRTAAGQKKATLMEEAPKNSSFSETTVACQHLDPPPDEVVWRFNHSDLILTWKRGEAFKAAAAWEKHVQEVSPAGDLTLTDLTPKHEGTYTCESSNSQETARATTLLLLAEDGGISGAAIAGIIFLVLIVIAAAIAVFYIRRKKILCFQEYKTTPQRDKELEP